VAGAIVSLLKLSHIGGGQPNIQRGEKASENTGGEGGMVRGKRKGRELEARGKDYGLKRRFLFG